MQRATLFAGSHLFIRIEDGKGIFLHGIIAAQANAAGLDFGHVKRGDAIEALPSKAIFAALFGETFNEHGEAALIIQLEIERHFLRFIDVPKAVDMF